MSRALNDSWPPETVGTMCKMWSDGCSAGLIAQAVGRSRNAVLGKLMRLGVTRDRAQPARSLVPTRLTVVKVKQPRARPVAVDMNDARAFEPLGAEAIAEKGCCKFMAGSWDRCCGRPVEASGAVYCDAHRAIAYRKKGKAA